MVNIFSLFPESCPVNEWMESNNDLQDEEKIVEFVKTLKEQYDLLKRENFIGYYDLKNVLNFLSDFEELKDWYPNPEFRLIRSMLASFNDWRDTQVEDLNADYTIYNLKIQDHTFCEIFERKIINPKHKFVILNHNAHLLSNLIAVTKDGKNLEFNSLITLKEIHMWISKERVPQRNFQITVKHGENRPDVRIIDNKEISPLKCSKSEAFELLQKAVGENRRELFFFDAKHNNYIVFKFEGNNPQNMFHGYHIEMDSSEIPSLIKKRIDRLIN